MSAHWVIPASHLAGHRWWQTELFALLVAMAILIFMSAATLAARAMDQNALPTDKRMAACEAIVSLALMVAAAGCWHFSIRLQGDIRAAKGAPLALDAARHNWLCGSDDCIRAELLTELLWAFTARTNAQA
jgi:hypothetical protein